MVPKKILFIIVLVIFSISSHYSWAQINATTVWDEFKEIASQRGFKISALVTQSEKGINIKDLS